MIYSHASDENNLRGTVPTELPAALTELTKLKLDSNHLTGTIPSNIGLLRHLVELDLDKNVLTGTLPDSLFGGGGSALEVLDLDSNRLGGTISSRVGDLEGLRWFQIDRNLFVGQIPVEVSSLSNLRTFVCLFIFCVLYYWMVYGVAVDLIEPN